MIMKSTTALFVVDLQSPPLPTTPPPSCDEGHLREIQSDYVLSENDRLQTVVDYRFEVCVGGHFTSVCDIGWGYHDAAVVCRDLRGYLYGSKFLTWWYSFLYHSLTFAGAEPLTGLPFTEQEEIYGLQDVDCSGQEYHLRQCQNSTAISSECSVGNHVAGVRCIDGMFKSCTSLNNCHCISLLYINRSRCMSGIWFETCKQYCPRHRQFLSGV